MIFSERFKAAVSAAGETTKAGAVAKSELLSLCSLINQATGDAMSDFLAVVGVLAATKFDDGEGGFERKFESWNALYSDLPSRQLKVKVKDRALIRTVEDESRCLEPVSLQSAIDRLVNEVASGAGKKNKEPARAFARPSGTEDVVRVYAEAGTQELADELANEVALAIFDHAQGVGDRSEFLVGEVKKRMRV